MGQLTYQYMHYISRLFVLVVGALLLSISNQAFSAPSTSPTAASSSPTLSSLVQTNNAEVQILQRQLEDSRKFQEQILATVYWSLGGLAAMAAALVGFGWFANFRVYERDKASLERDLRAQMSEDANTLRSQTNDLLMAVEKRIQESLTIQVGQVDDSIRSSVKDVSNDLEGKISAAQGEASSNIGVLKRQVLKLQIESVLSARNSWVKKEVFRNALQASVSALEYANQIGSDYQLGEILDLVSADISTILSRGTNPIDNFLVAQLVSALDSVKGTHAYAAANIKAGTGALLVK